jgi:hypothetical protein
MALENGTVPFTTYGFPYRCARPTNWLGEQYLGRIELLTSGSDYKICESEVSPGTSVRLGRGSNPNFK